MPNWKRAIEWWVATHVSTAWVDAIIRRDFAPPTEAAAAANTEWWTEEAFPPQIISDHRAWNEMLLLPDERGSAKRREASEA